MLDGKIKFALDALTAGGALLGTAAIAGSGECGIVFRVCIWLIASFDEDVLLRFPWIIAIVPSEASLVLKLLTEVCERVVEGVAQNWLTLTSVSNPPPSSPANEIATISIFQNLDPVELVVVAIDIGLVQSRVVDDSMAVNVDTMRVWFNLVGVLFIKLWSLTGVLVGVLVYRDS